MRITNNIMISHFMTNLNGIMQRMDKMQGHLSSGKTINKPSDNPIGTARSMQLNTDLVETAQYTTNTDYGISWAESAESALNSATDVMHRARELAIQGMNGAYAQDSRDAIANEIEQLRQQMVELGNTSNGGRFVFGGAKTSEAPFKDMKPVNGATAPIPPEVGAGYIFKNTGTELTTGGPFTFTIKVGNTTYPTPPGVITVAAGADNQSTLANMKSAIDTASIPGLTATVVTDAVAGTSQIKITSAQQVNFTDVTGDLAARSGAASTYNGDNSKIMVQIGAGVNIDINVPGGEPFTTNIAALTNLRNALKAGANAENPVMKAALNNMDKAVETTLTVRSDLGARTNRLELVKYRLEDLDLNFNKLLSNNEDTDIAEVIMNLKMQESVQRSALAVGGRIIPPTLVDFLR